MDLNADIGEGLFDVESELIPLLTSVSIACGGHYGDNQTMSRSFRAAVDSGLNVGAHPSYPDRERFGRRSIAINLGALRDSIHNQVQSLRRVADEQGSRVTHIKPHGALYSDASRDRQLLEIILGIADDFGLPVIMLAASPALSPNDNAILEGFIDRGYRDDGSLLPRTIPGAVISDPSAAAAQAVRLVRSVETLCVHSDSPNAPALLRSARSALEQAGFEIGPART